MIAQVQPEAVKVSFFRGEGGGIPYGTLTEGTAQETLLCATTQR